METKEVLNARQLRSMRISRLFFIGFTIFMIIYPIWLIINNQPIILDALLLDFRGGIVGRGWNIDSGASLFFLFIFMPLMFNYSFYKLCQRNPYSYDYKTQIGLSIFLFLLLRLGLYGVLGI